MKQITLTNDFHGTSVNVVPVNGLLSASQVARARRALCGSRDCQCGGYAGTRGRQRWAISPTGARDYVGMGAWMVMWFAVTESTM